MNAARVVLVLAATGLAVASCRDASLAPAPALAVAASGGELYSTFCAACHGPEGAETALPRRSAACRPRT